MAAQFISLNLADAAATHAARIKAVHQKTQTLLDDLENLVDESNQMFDGVGSEQFTLPMTKYGTATKAEAQTVFNLMNGTLAALKGTAQNANALELASRIG